MVVPSCLLALSAFVAGALALPAAFSIADRDASFAESGNVTEFDLVRRAKAISFNQDYVASGAGVTYSPNLGAGTFSVNYNTHADFVVGLGWQPGDHE